MFRKTAAKISAAAVAAALLASFAPAPAHAALTDCPKGYVCIWADVGGRTLGLERAYVKFQWYIPNYADYKYEGTNFGSANTATSIINNGRYDTAVMYANSFKRTQLFTIPVGNRNGWLTYSHNDNIESGYFWTYN